MVSDESREGAPSDHETATDNPMAPGPAEQVVAAFGGIAKAIGTDVRVLSEVFVRDLS